MNEKIFTLANTNIVQTGNPSGKSRSSGLTILINNLINLITSSKKNKNKDRVTISSEKAIKKIMGHFRK